jgi:hypothetical protein
MITELAAAISSNILFLFVFQASTLLPSLLLRLNRGVRSRITGDVHVASHTVDVWAAITLRGLRYRDIANKDRCCYNKQG